jgi:hypothetical protein
MKNCASFPVSRSARSHHQTGRSCWSKRIRRRALISRPLGVLAFPVALALVAQSIGAQEAGVAEKIRDVSPDQKFAVRILYDEKENERVAAEFKDRPGKHPLADGIFWPSIKAIELVSMPSKEKVADLIDPERSMTSDYTLIWSADSHWCALYQNEVNSGYTSVFNERDGKFVKLQDADDLHVIKGDFRKEWIQPTKWAKPGVLILIDEAIGNSGVVKFEVTVRFDAEGKIHVIRQKRLKPEAT